MERIILCILALGAAIGGLDLLFGNRLKLGEKFEEGFQLLGPTALTMAGILCLAPLLSDALQQTLAPVWRAIHLDPAMLGGILAIDMGGYQTAAALAEDAQIGNFAGILVSSTLGCTITYTIPLGAGLLKGEDMPGFYKGMLIGLGVMPVALLIGGMASGIGAPELLIQMLPVVILSILMMIGLKWFPGRAVRAFSFLAKILRWASILGLTLAAMQYISHFTFLPQLGSIEESMKTVSGIGIVMLGSLPTAELLRRLLSKPLTRLGRKIGMQDESLSALFVCFVSVTPVLAMMKNMDERGRMVNAAFSVCAASALAAHLGFTLNAASEMMIPLLLTKLVGGLMAVALAFLSFKKDRKA